MLNSIFLLLTVILIVAVALFVKVLWSFRNLSEKRLAIYVEYAGYLNKCVYDVRQKNFGGLKDRYGEREGQFILIASVPTLNASHGVYNALSEWAELLVSGRPTSEFAAIENKTEEALVDLYAAMRMDLALSGSQLERFPNAELFRKRRSKTENKAINGGQNAPPMDE